MSFQSLSIVTCVLYRLGVVQLSADDSNDLFGNTVFLVKMEIKTHSGKYNHHMEPEAGLKPMAPFTDLKDLMTF